MTLFTCFNYFYFTLFDDLFINGKLIFIVFLSIKLDLIVIQFSPLSVDNNKFKYLSVKL